MPGSQSGSGLLLRHYLLLALLGICVTAPVAILQQTPGYMDAEYYYAGGLRLVNGYGFSEEILWNYLDNPDGLPHPSHGYWMPLISILAAGGMWLTGSQGFPAARLPFLIIFALIPPLTAALSYSMGKRSRFAVISGLLAIFSAFYLSFMTTTDAFGAYMLLGTVFILLSGNYKNSETIPKKILISLFIGLVSGLMHLTRTDGILWLILALLVIIARAGFQKRGTLLVSFGVCLLGYSLVMAPWMARNYQVFGTILAPGSYRALWFIDYDDLFLFPADLITFTRWWGTGLEKILLDRLWAFGQNLQTAMAVQGAIFMAPFILVGIWRFRRDERVWVGCIAWIITLVAMTVPFPYAGARGGFFHSGAALQPFFWAIAPFGMEVFISWVGAKRAWNIPQAQRFFNFSLVTLALTLSVFVFYTRVIGGEISNPVWNEGQRKYTRQEESLVDLGVNPDDVVLVNNPPGYHNANNRSTIAIPSGDIPMLVSAAHKFSARYLLLEFNQLRSSEDLYADPHDRPGLQYLGTFEDTRIYKISSQ